MTTTKKAIADVAKGAAFVSILAFPASALAHSTVSPIETITSKYETFTLSVPTEKDMPTVGVKLLIPEGLTRVTPFVKTGWNITVTKDEGGKVTQVEWRGGAIPAGQKDVFLFTAPTPKEPTTLIWKVYQTYLDGSVVAWDQDPKSHVEASHDKEEKVANPYSSTDVVSAVAPAARQGRGDKLPYAASFAALALSIAALVLARRKA